MSRVCHIIVAAGSGARFGSELPKQFCLLRGRPVLMTTVDNFRNACPDDKIVLVLSKDCVRLWHGLCREYGYPSPEIAYGGATRWNSVKNALESVDDGVDIITVHDGARPLVSRDVIGKVVAAVESGACGAIPVVPVTDSLRIIDDDGVSEAVDRSVMRAVQTPQAFRAEILRKAYGRPYSPLYTDDASVVEDAGFTPLALVDGDVHNIKITHPADLDVAAVILDRYK